MFPVLTCFGYRAQPQIHQRQTWFIFFISNISIQFKTFDFIKVQIIKLSNCESSFGRISSKWKNNPWLADTRQCIVSYSFSALSSSRKLYFTLNKTSCGIVVLLNSCDHPLQKLQPFQPPSPCHYWTNMILLIITIIHLNAYLVFKFKLIFQVFIFKVSWVLGRALLLL